MKYKADIKANSLKDFLSLFESNEILGKLSLGDTHHKQSGFVNEEILNGKHQVSDLLDFDYDFKGLVHFEAQIESMVVKLDKANSTASEDLFELIGSEKELIKVQNRVIEINALNPGTFEININRMHNNED